MEFVVQDIGQHTFTVVFKKNPSLVFINIEAGSAQSKIFKCGNHLFSIYYRTTRSVDENTSLLYDIKLLMAY